MPKYQPPFRRKNTANGHYYVDAAGARVPGVTTLTDGGLPKTALINWSANATADAAVNRWDELSTMPPAQRLKVLQGARYEDKDRAAKRGTEVHRYAEHLLHGQSVTVPDELVGHVESYARWMDDFAVEPVHVEFPLASYKWGYAGTGDLICWVTTQDMGRHLALIDTKTNRSGIFGETALQLSGYRYADVLLEPERPMPEVAATYAVWVRGDGADLVPVETSLDLQRVLLYAAAVRDWDKTSRDLIGAPVRPVRSHQHRLVRDEVGADTVVVGS